MLSHRPNKKKEIARAGSLQEKPGRASSRLAGQSWRNGWDMHEDMSIWGY